MRQRRHPNWNMLLMLLGVVAAACSSGGSAGETPTPAPPAYTWETATQPGPLSVGVTTLTMTDTSRPTAANGGFAGKDERRMTVEVWYPAATPAGAEEARDAPVDAAAEPYPLIVFAHGLSSSRVQSTTYTRHLASHGYIVAAPDFPLTNAGSPGGPNLRDIVNQPADVSFVIDQMLARSGDAGSPFHNAIDSGAVGLTGHSLGGFTTLLSLYGGHRDERIGAALSMAGSGCFLADNATHGVSVPIMLMIGSDDLVVAPQGNRRAYDLANAPRYWVQLTGGGHVRFADADVDDELVVGPLQRLIGGGALALQRAETAPASCSERQTSSPDPKVTLARQQELLRAFATPFFDFYLRGDESAKRFLTRDLPGLTQGAAQYEFEDE